MLFRPLMMMLELLRDAKRTGRVRLREVRSEVHARRPVRPELRRRGEGLHGPVKE
jgi:hypothetical protein